jgi:HlyD family secretion protein
VSLLPDANRKVRFFVPERLLAKVALGDEVGVTCDGCASRLTAKVEFVATEAEFTPPILYSKDSRDKLVFRVDARPEAEAVSLKVGQPLDIHLAGAAP